MDVGGIRNAEFHTNLAHSYGLSLPEHSPNKRTMLRQTTSGLRVVSESQAALLVLLLAGGMR